LQLVLAAAAKKRQRKQAEEVKANAAAVEKVCGCGLCPSHCVVQQRKSAALYEVERVLEQRVKGGLVQYRVRWKGYTAEDDSWLEEDRFDDGNVPLAEFKQSRKRARLNQSSSSSGR
jgi:hypothetical protein